MNSRTIVANDSPTSVKDLDLGPRGRVFPSPPHWKDHIFYQVLPDRFSDGREAGRPLFDRDHPEAHRAPDKRAWMEAGLRFNGGNLQGIRSKLDYLQGLGVTGLWINPVFKQRADLQTYHGYAIQDFLQVDPRFGTIQDLRELLLVHVDLHDLDLSLELARDLVGPAQVLDLLGRLRRKGDRHGGVSEGVQAGAGRYPKGPNRALSRMAPRRAKPASSERKSRTPGDFGAAPSGRPTLGMGYVATICS